MPLPPSNPQDTQAAIAVAVAVIAAWAVFYWRTALKVAVLVILAVIAYGVIAGLLDASSLLAAHRH